MSSKKTFFYSIALLVGTTVGIGIFGVPFAFSKAGFLIGIAFLILTGALVLITNLAYGEVILRTNGMHQLTGYAGIYLGEKWKKPVLFSMLLSMYSALLAYVIISGEFLATLLSGFVAVKPVTWSILFFIIVSLISLMRIKRVAAFEFFMEAFLLTVISIVLLVGLPKVSFSSFSGFQKEFALLPYGVLLFALSGMSAVTLQKEVLADREEYLKKSIFIGTLIPIVLYLIFAFVIVGISGDSTSPEAISGIIPYLGEEVGILASLFGIMAISTAYVSLSKVVMEAFQFDFRFKKLLSWLMTILPPFVLFMSGTRDFIRVINLAGGVAIGLGSIIFIFLYHNARRKGTRIPEYSLQLPAWIWYAMMVLFTAGIFYTIYF